MNLVVRLGPCFVEWFVPVGLTSGRVVHFHADTECALAVGLVQRTGQLAVPNVAHSLDLFGDLVGGFVESVPIGGSGRLDHGKCETMHSFFFHRPSRYSPSRSPQPGTTW